MTKPDPVERPRPPAPAAGFWSEHGLSDLALLALTVLALLLCYLIARPFVTSLAWATALAVVGWPLHRRIERRVPWPTASAALSVITIALLMIAPSGMVIPGAVDEALSGWEWLRQRLDLGDVLQQAGAALTAIGSFAVKSSFVATIEFVLTFFFLFYFLRDRGALLVSVRGLLPLPPAEADRNRIGTIRSCPFG